jgi:ABC-type methionine transport system ATPase subunit
MLFDELTFALVPEMTSEVLDVIVDLADSGMTMIVVKQKMGFARRAAGKMVPIDHGVIVEIRRILPSQANQFIYIVKMSAFAIRDWHAGTHALRNPAAFYRKPHPRGLS